MKEDLVAFQINLTVLLDCLNIFGGSPVAGKKKGILENNNKIANSKPKHSSSTFITLP